MQLSLAGDELADKDKWADAADQYDKALVVWPGNRFAEYGLGRCAQANGDYQTAILYYRSDIYDSVGGEHQDDILETDPVKLARFAILLCQTDQYKEALIIYRHAILPYYPPLHAADADDVLPPTFLPGSWALTPKRLEAMAYVVLGDNRWEWDRSEAAADYQHAIKLAPDSAVAHYFAAVNQMDRGKARPDMELALKLDDGTNAAAIKHKYYLWYQFGWPGDTGEYRP
jgi:tetratricopeptide (TPR) repeat protein